MLALANTFATVGWAVLSLDGPRAGARMLSSLGDQDVDGCGDQPDIPELIDSDPFVVRDLLREWALELVQVQTMARFSPETLARLRAEFAVYAEGLRSAYLAHRIFREAMGTDPAGPDSREDATADLGLHLGVS